MTDVHPKERGIKVLRFCLESQNFRIITEGHFFEGGDTSVLYRPCNLSPIPRKKETCIEDERPLSGYSN